MRWAVHQAPGNYAEYRDCLKGTDGIVVIVLKDPGVGVGGIGVSCHGRMSMRADNKGGLGCIFL